MYLRCWAPWPAIALALVAAAVIPTAANAEPKPGASAAQIEAASWHGRAIREPRRSIVPDDAVRWPDGWSAGAVGFGTGYVREGGSARVRTVQRLLRGLGYRPGPVDGRFGPRTAAATGWFQYKHGLPSTGVVNARTLTVLRARSRGRDLSAPERTRDRPSTRGERTSPAAQAPVRRAGPDRAAQAPPSSTTDLTPFVLVLALALWLATMALHARSRKRERPAHGLVPPPAQADVQDRGPRMLGYVALDRDELPEGVPTSVFARLDAECERREWSLSRVVHDVEPASGRVSDRPGLFHALDVIATGGAAGLIVPRLRDLTASVTDLGPLMRWFDEADARLVVLDVGLDTREDAGRTVARALAEVSKWERQRIGERTRNGLAATRSSRRGTSREAVEDDPDLVAWIQQMRADGMSLQAIADTLNAHGVPTRRGGSHWRPSSVQTAAGYRRPPARGSAGDLPAPKGRDP